MSRICWDSMLFLYLLEANPQFAARTEHLLGRSHRRGDKLYTTCLAAGEVLAGAANSPDASKTAQLRNAIAEMGFQLLPFDEGAIEIFGILRAKKKLKIADAVNLACAASAGIDLFLTGDQQLFGIDVPGVQFIADFNSSIL
ncbi:MAG TPA: PIN domain-containing protein [Acidobacteriaceae bacterium]